MGGFFCLKEELWLKEAALRKMKEMQIKRIPQCIRPWAGASSTPNLIEFYKTKCEFLCLKKIFRFRRFLFNLGLQIVGERRKLDAKLSEGSKSKALLVAEVGEHVRHLNGCQGSSPEVGLGHKLPRGGSVPKHSPENNRKFNVTILCKLSCLLDIWRLFLTFNKCIANVLLYWHLLDNPVFASSFSPEPILGIIGESESSDLVLNLVSDLVSAPPPPRPHSSLKDFIFTLV